MGHMFVGITFNVIEYWILILMMQSVCSAHINLNRYRIIFCTALAIVGNFLAYISQKWYTDFLMVGLIALTVFLYSSRKFKDLLLFFPALIIYFIVTVLPESMLEELFPALEWNYVLDGYPLRLAGLATDIVLLIVLILLRHILLKYETAIHLSIKEILGCIGLLFFSIIDIMLLMTINRSDIQQPFYYIWKFVFVGAFIFTVAYYLFELIEFRIRIYRQTLSRSETEYLRIQLDSLQDIKENEKQVKQLRHDLQNHLTVIQSLCEEGSYDEIRDYTKNLKNDIVLTDSYIPTGNKVADLVVRSKLKDAREHSIDFTFNGSLEQLGPMEPPDICGLLANAYDNAIEACLSQESPYIHTQISVTRNFTVILITNSVNHKVSVRGNRIPTTKTDKHSHGYGIDIMKRIAHKYNGSCTLSSSENEFAVKIVLLNRTNH